MEPGTIVETLDGRIGTVVYRGLDGEGIRFGEHEMPTHIKARLIELGSFHKNEDYELRKWAPEAMLRDDYPGATMPCIGEAARYLNCQSCLREGISVMLTTERACPRCEPEEAEA